MYYYLFITGEVEVLYCKACKEKGSRRKIITNSRRTGQDGDTLECCLGDSEYP